MPWVKNHRFYIEKKNCEKRENISWNYETRRKNMHEIKQTYIKKQKQDKLFNGLYNISYINKTSTMFMYI